VKPKGKPPFSVNVLHRWIADAERETGVAVARQQRWVSFMVLAGMLDATVKFEVAPAEGTMGHEIDRVPAKALDHLGLAGPADVPCVAIRWQIAQKLHACTEVPDGERVNDRFRDLIDLLLLWDLVPPDQRSPVREACREIFALRRLHPWPPRITVFDTWPAEYRALAAELCFPLPEVDAAALAVQEMIDGINAG